ncbi:MAG: flavodoxin domain-containing protein [Candidatus Thorarchaeota archaeon]|jgi:flavorubredoxin
MSMKQVLVIYDTQFGNTKRLAEEIAAGIEEVGDISCTLTRQQDLEGLEVTSYDGVLFGCPVHATTATRGIKGAIKKAASVGLDGKLGAVFDTYMGPQKSRAVNKMESEIQKRAPGMKLFTPGLSALVDGFRGPLNEAELPKAREYGKSFGAELLGP